MLESCLFESRPDHGRNGGRKKPITLAMSTGIHVLIAAALILIPMLQTQAVPPVALPPPPVSLAPQVRVIKLAATPSSSRAAHPISPAPSDALTEPTAVPEKVSYVEDSIDIASLESFNPGPSNGPAGPNGPIGAIGLPFSVALPTVAPPPRPPDPPAPPPAPKIPIREPIRVGSTLQNSRLVRQVDPVYPILAKRAGVEGTVIAEARITQSGTIDSLRIISGNPLFHHSVLEAVKQWRYEPAIFNGDPIEVITTITVNFKLN